MCVNNLPKVGAWKREAGSRTNNLQSRMSNALTTTPRDHTLSAALTSYLKQVFAGWIPPY